MHINICVLHINIYIYLFVIAHLMIRVYGATTKNEDRNHKVIRYKDKIKTLTIIHTLSLDIDPESTHFSEDHISDLTLFVCYTTNFQCFGFLSI